MTVVVLAGVLGGCLGRQAAPPADTRPEKYSQQTLDCIFISTIDSWKYLDPYHVIIYAPTRSHAYVLELGNNCEPLHYAERIGISSHQNGRLCARDQDALLVGDQRCSIMTIQPYAAAGPKAAE